VCVFTVLRNIESRKWKIAKKHAEAALKLAYCDEGPPYHYKVAYEEAEALLEKLK